jgi:tripartite-type tricarboxylate transporter receptor subunit TctC
LAIAAFVSVSTARADAVKDFPTKPVTVITPFAAGSGPDAVMRLVAEKLARRWNQRVLIENKPGGAGFIAIDAAKRAPQDGYTLLQLDSEHMAALPHLYKSKRFAPFTTFEPVAALFRTPFFITVPAISPWQSVGDLIAAAKAKPNGISYGSWGVGSPAHLGAQQLEMLAGLNMLHIPFREVGQLYSSVATGEVSWAFGTLPSSRGVYETGKLRYLAVAAPRRVPQMPQVPTVAEAGGPKELNFNGFVVLVAPKGIATGLAAKINADVVAALSEPDVRAQFNTFAFEALEWSAANVRQEVDSRSGLYRQLIERGNIRLD